MIASVPACFAVSPREPYGDKVALVVFAYGARDGVCCWDPHLRIEVGSQTIVLSLAESEMLETALRVARQSVRPRR